MSEGIAGLVKKNLRSIPYIRKFFIERDEMRIRLHNITNTNKELFDTNKVLLDGNKVLLDKISSMEEEARKNLAEMQKTGNRYANDWNSYSKTWDSSKFGKQYRHLGDEWNDDGTAVRATEKFIFSMFAERFLRPDSTVMEVGPGGGKWTVQIAPQVKKMYVLDVSEEMLKRTRKRCDDLGLTNIEFIQGSGDDFLPVPDESVDFFFSYDVFVHIALEDTFCYVMEMARVLKPGAMGSCHHANNANADAWNRIQHSNEWYRKGGNTLGQYYYHSPESLRRMYEHCGLTIAEQYLETWHCINVFSKSGHNSLAQMEHAFNSLMSVKAEDDEVRRNLIQALADMLKNNTARAEQLLDRMSNEKDYHERTLLVQQMRHIWRGTSISGVVKD